MNQQLNQQTADKIIGFIELNTPSMTAYSEYKAVRDYINSLVSEDEKLMGDVDCPMCDTTFNKFMPVWDLPQHILNEIALRKWDEYQSTLCHRYSHPFTYYLTQQKEE